MLPEMPPLGYQGPLLIHRSMLWSMRMWHGLTQSELAERVGVTRQTISSLERARSTPSVTLATALAFELDIAVEDLFDAAHLN
jgi:putative transcriptional regulator